MIVDGKGIAHALQTELKEIVQKRGVSLILGIVSMSKSPVTDKYLSRKKQFAESIRVSVEEASLGKGNGQKEIEEAVRKLVTDSSVTGILVQLPLPPHIDTGAILNFIPPERDPDVLSERARNLFKSGKGVLPPVIGAMKEILGRNFVSLSGKKAVVVGEGNLVGKPAAVWLTNGGAQVKIVTELTQDPAPILQRADIVVCGAGVPGLIKPEMLKEGVILLDAGTTDVSGSLKGDADPLCAERCSIFTPVPGGVGPITIAMIFKNLITLSQKS